MCLSIPEVAKTVTLIPKFNELSELIAQLCPNNSWTNDAQRALVDAKHYALLAIRHPEEK